MSEERIITADGATAVSTDATLTTDGTTTNVSAQKPVATTTLQERISAIVKCGGLKELPPDFDTQNGDWKSITSAEPFSILYLDYKQAVFITPDIVSSHYRLLDDFWRNKKLLMNTGANRIVFKRKYSHPEGADNGERIVDNSIAILKTAYDKLATKEGIERYFEELNSARIRNGADKLADSIRQMVMDGDATKDEISFCLEQGLRYDLLENETAGIIKKAFDELNITPYGGVSGNTLATQLLSVDHWMTNAKQNEAERIKKDREALKIQILKGKYASTVEEMGTILFESPGEAKELIKKDTLKGAVSQKDLVLSGDIADITKAEKDLNLAFYKIVYKLNPALPYPFADKNFLDIPSLCIEISGNARNMKQGKEDLSKGYIETWLKETNPDAYILFLKIRDTADNIDLALLSFLYTFNPALPYRLGGSYLINNPKYLTETIDSSNVYWEEGKTELFDGSIGTWLRVALKSNVPGHWQSVKDRFAQHGDVGLEYFIRQVNQELTPPVLEANLTNINHPTIQSGQIVTTDIVFTNTTRGAIEVHPTLTKAIDGISLSSSAFLINNISGKNQCAIQFIIDSTNLMKGITYQTAIIVKTTEKQELSIPVSFNIVFPKNAFIKQIALYACIGAVFFALIRLTLASQYPEWLSHSFDFFASWNTAINNGWYISIFGWLMLLFIAGLYFGVFYLIKFLRRK